MMQLNDLSPAWLARFMGSTAAQAAPERAQELLEGFLARARRKGEEGLGGGLESSSPAGLAFGPPGSK
jgi:hypothetical protein